MDHNRKVVELPLDDILPNRFQPRIKFNEDSIIDGHYSYPMLFKVTFDGMVVKNVEVLDINV